MKIASEKLKSQRAVERTREYEYLQKLQDQNKSKRGKKSQQYTQFKYQKQSINQKQHPILSNYLNPILLFILIASSSVAWADNETENKLKSIQRLGGSEKAPIQRLGESERVDKHQLKPTKRPTKSSNVVNNKLQPIQRLETITVSAARVTRDSKGQDAVFKDNLTTEYHGKEYIERYKGSNPGDMFSGMVGVYSSDSRNSGAIVPNIRGVQEFERVPLTIDGTEQAIVTNRGFGGISTRSYLDPMLIGNMTVIKGGALRPGSKTGVGGAVMMETLAVNDIVKPGKKFGIDFKMELANNSVKPRIPNNTYGINNELLPFPISTLNAMSEMNSVVSGKVAKDNQFFKFRDSAFRIAVGWRGSSTNAMVAYVERNKGNHFTGKKGSGFYDGYKNNDLDPNSAEARKVRYRTIARGVKPGYEMMNTSFNTKSLLAKFGWSPTDDQQFKLIARHTDARYGDILPTRTEEYALNDFRAKKMGYYAFPQWPLSKVKTDALSLNYTYNPIDNRWLDLNANLWLVKMKNQTYHNGGTVVALVYPRHAPDTHTNCMAWSIYNTRKCLTANAAELRNHEQRFGLTLSNRFELSPQLTMTLAGDYQHEKLGYTPKSWNLVGFGNTEKNNRTVFGDFGVPAAGFEGRQSDRAGRKRDYTLDIHFDWEPSTWLEFGLGARYKNSWMFDDELQRKATIGKKTVVSKNQGIKLHVMSYGKENRTNPGFDPHLYKGNWLPDEVMWNPSEDGKYQLKDHPILNGEIPIDGINYAWAVEPDPTHPLWGKDNNAVMYDIIKPVLTLPEDRKSWDILVANNWEHRLLPVFKRRYASWSGDASVALKFTPNSRLYLRYSNMTRHPSLFEMTSGFGQRPFTTYQSYLFNPLAERSSNTEIAYVHDLKDWLKAKNFADIKFSYYHTLVKNALDRDYTFRIMNTDKHLRTGVELQSRYDHGRWFGDLKFSKELKNIVCDKSSAYQLDPYHFSQQECVLGGFQATVVNNILPPKYNIVLHLGSRWFNEKLEVGSRLTYYSERQQDLKDQIGWQIWTGMDSNRTIEWGKIFLVDAYLNYQITKDISVELVGSNLSNRYYLDPITRSYAVAPGRTIRMGLNAKF